MLRCFTAFLLPLLLTLPLQAATLVRSVASGQWSALQTWENGHVPAYQIQNWRFKLTCENFTDQRHYLASQGFADTIVPGAPRTFMFGVEVKF